MSSSTVPASARSEAPAGAKTASADSGRGVRNAGALLPAEGERGCSLMRRTSYPPPCPG